MIRIGTSGFSFKDWKGTVYPENLSSQDTLIYYQRELGFDCVEINATYYTLLSDKTFAGMEKKTGDSMLFQITRKKSKKNFLPEKTKSLCSDQKFRVFVQTLITPCLWEKTL